MELLKDKQWKRESTWLIWSAQESWVIMSIWLSSSLLLYKSTHTNSNVFSKNVYSSIDKFYSTLNNSKSELFIQNYYKISERHVGISLGENKYYYIKRGTTTQKTGKLFSYQGK